MMFWAHLRGSPCQHIGVNEGIGYGTLCNSAPIADHRVEFWEFTKGITQFDNYRLCFLCNNVLARRNPQFQQGVILLAKRALRAGHLRAVS